MSSVNQLAYVGIEASDLADWERFGVDLLGMQLGSRSADSCNCAWMTKSIDG
jgi:hypothetical protein